MGCLQCSPHSFKTILGFHRPASSRPEVNTNTIVSINGVPSFTHFTLRFKNAARLETRRQKIVHVYASNNNSSEGSEVTKSSTDDNVQGPPLLTILAGLFVFFLIFWIIGSIVMWLVGLIINPPVK